MEEIGMSDGGSWSWRTRADDGCGRQGAGNDFARGGLGADTVVGGEGADRLEVADGGLRDTVYGGGGNGTCVVDPADARFGCENVIMPPV
jgi:Ca2+-binding RTX toxin-like protein